MAICALNTIHVLKLFDMRMLFFLWIFTTTILLSLGCKIDPIPSLPEVKILSFNSCDNLSFEIEGEILSGEGNLNSIQVCSSNSPNPTQSDTSTVAVLQGSQATFTTTIITKDRRQTIFVKAFASSLDNSISASNTIELKGIKDKWALLNSALPIQRINAVAFEVNGKVYAGLGRTGEKTYLSDFWEYDPTNCEHPESLRSFPGAARAEAAGFVIDNIIYVGTGIGIEQDTERVFNDFFAYDINQNFWYEVDSLPNQSSGRKGATGFSIYGKGYILTGCGGVSCRESSLKRDVWEYSFGIGWTSKNDFDGSPRGDANGFVIDNKFYFGLGFMKDEVDSTEYNIDFWEYDPTIDFWKPLDDFISLGRHGFIGFAMIRSKPNN